MSTSNLIIIFLLILSIFLLLEVYVFFSQIIPILIDKSFGDKTEINSKLNNKKAVMKTYFFIFFVISFFMTIYLIKSSDSLILITLYFVLGCIPMFLFHYYSTYTVNNNKYFKNTESSTLSAGIFNELKPSLLSADEIKKQFDYALEQNYFNCELLQFENLLKLNEPIEKIIWKPISHVKYKDRQLLLSFLHKLFQKQLNKKSRKGICEFINKYFELNEIGHNKQENPFTPDNIEKWINNPKSVL